MAWAKLQPRKIFAPCLRGRLNYLVYGRRVGLKPSRVKASPPTHEAETETDPENDKQELVGEGMTDCITLLEQHSLLDRLMEWDLGLPEELRSAHLPESHREALGQLHGRGGLHPRSFKPQPPVGYKVVQSTTKAGCTYLVKAIAFTRYLHPAFVVD